MASELDLFAAYLASPGATKPDFIALDEWPTAPGNETLEACRKGHLNCAHTANGQCHDDLLVRGKRSCERKGQCSWDFGGNDSEELD